MKKTLTGPSQEPTRIAPKGLSRGLGWGLIGGLAGTVSMDLLLMGALAALGLPASLCFSIVGDTVSHFLALFGGQIAGGVPTGVVTHYVVGPLFGILFGAAVTMLPALREAPLKKIMIAAFLYVELLSQPILATTPILLSMKAPAILQWFGGSFFMHMILSIILGVIVGYGLRPAPRGAQIAALKRWKEKSMQYDLSTKTKPAYRARGLNNLLCMGHCAPAVMKTVLDINHTQREDLVRLTAGMPGGIGSTGFECGGITSPLVLLGLRYGLREMHDGLPRIFDLGHRYYHLFSTENHATFCKDIQNPRLPVGCIHAVRHSTELLAETLESDYQPAIAGEQREAYTCLYGHMQGGNFHCARTVFQHLEGPLSVNPELLEAASAFTGGTLFKGLTCGAFTAGVMAIGIKLGEIENSYLRVTRMLALMASGGNAFRDDLNKFNRAINTGHRLSKWFRKEFGSTQCQDIVQCDFSCQTGARKYIDTDGLTRCRGIARMTAEQVQNILEKTE